jgi:hypothetical protein
MRFWPHCRGRVHRSSGLRRPRPTRWEVPETYGHLPHQRRLSIPGRRIPPGHRPWPHPGPPISPMLGSRYALGRWKPRDERHIAEKCSRRRGASGRRRRLFGGGSPETVRRSICIRMSTSGMVPRLVDNNDDDSGSARNAPLFMMTVGRAFLLVPRVSISAGERSRDRHRG